VGMILLPAFAMGTHSPARARIFTFSPWAAGRSQPVRDRLSRMFGAVPGKPRPGWARKRALGRREQSGESDYMPREKRA
jgi:hypothetical protein